MIAMVCSFKKKARQVPNTIYMYLAKNDINFIVAAGSSGEDDVMLFDPLV